MSDNPLLTNWEGPYGGVPPFDRVQVPLFKPAMEAAMAEQLAEVDRIAKNTEAPTFENTIVALENAGKTLNRVGTLYGVWGGTMSGPEFQTTACPFGFHEPVCRRVYPADSGKRVCRRLIKARGVYSSVRTSCLRDDRPSC